MGFLSELFGKKSQKSSSDALTPEMREVFDRMYGVRPGSGAGSSACSLCGAPNPAHVVMCRQCMEQMKSMGNSSFHSCGGCGAGFLVEPNIDIHTFTMNGVVRLFCACCLDRLRGEMTGGNVSMPPTLPGYDREGQLLNSRLLGQPVSIKLKSRANQGMILTLIQNKAKREGTQIPVPLLITDPDLIN
jgi:hypothetical protein